MANSVSAKAAQIQLEMEQDEALPALSVKGRTEQGASVTWTLRAQHLTVQHEHALHVSLYNLLDIHLKERKLEIAYVDHVGHGHAVKIERKALQLGSDDDDDDKQTPLEFCDEALRRAYRGAVPRRRALVLINPNAGNGRAAQTWDEQVKPIFEAAGMTIAKRPTTERNGARRAVQAWDLSAIDCIVVCSGDGLIHEVFNGLAFHNNAGNALSKVAVAHIPCGSGNALARNLHGAPLTPDHAALAIVKGIDSRIDLMEITQPNADGTVERSFSFLSQAIGIMAECDLDTEWMRKIAPKARFGLGFLSRAIQCKKYRFDVAFKTEVAGRDALVAHTEQHRGGEQAWERRAVSLGQLGSPESPESPASPEKPVHHDAAGPLPLPRSRYGTILDPLPGGWQAHRFKDLATLYCGNMPYMSSTDHIFTAACISDGTMDLIYSRSTNPLFAIDHMTKIAGGKADLDSSSVPYQKISGLRVTPLDKQGSLSIDGERFPWRPFQAEIHRGLARVISSSGVYRTEGPSKEQRRPAPDGRPAG